MYLIPHSDISAISTDQNVAGATTTWPLRPVAYLATVMSFFLAFFSVQQIFKQGSQFNVTSMVPGGKSTMLEWLPHSSEFAGQTSCYATHRRAQWSAKKAMWLRP